MGRLAGKAALITGGGGGIGAACARIFCAEGAALILVDANAEALDGTVRDIRSAHPEAQIAACLADVSDGVRAREVVGEALHIHGRLDILVNNAAMRNYSSIVEATAEEWKAVVDVNLMGTAAYCKAAIPALRRSGKASIVNVSSCYAVTGRKGMAIYDATKAAQLALTRSLAFEEADHGIRANAVCPGSTLTDFHLGRAQASGKTLEKLRTERTDTSLLKRWAAPEEIAWPILWLSSDEASFITGTTLLVDGGLHVM